MTIVHLSCSHCGYKHGSVAQESQQFKTANTEGMFCPTCRKVKSVNRDYVRPRPVTP
jgi:hypothetical protein